MCQWMRRSLLETRGGAEQIDARHAIERQHVGDFGLAFGQRAGLVDDERPQSARMLQRSCVPYQHTKLRTAAGADDDRGGCRQSKRTGAGDDQHRDRVDQGLRAVAAEPPRKRERRQRDDDDNGHKYARHLVGEPLDRRFRGLRVRDEAYDPREQRRIADASGFAYEQAFLIQRSRMHACARGFDNRARFAGEHALVDARLPFADDAVDGDALARPNDEAVSNCDVGERHLGLRLEPQQSFQRRRRAGLGTRLEELAQQHQRDHCRSGFEINMLLPQVENGNHGAQRPRHRRSQRDQHVHVGAAAAQRVPGTDVEAAADPELHRRGKRQLQPARQQLRMRAAVP